MPSLSREIVLILTLAVVSTVGFEFFLLGKANWRKGGAIITGTGLSLMLVLTFMITREDIHQRDNVWKNQVAELAIRLANNQSGTIQCPTSTTQVVTRLAPESHAEDWKKRSDYKDIVSYQFSPKTTNAYVTLRANGGVLERGYTDYYLAPDANGNAIEVELQPYDTFHCVLK